MKKILVYLADGFEEIEGLTVVDILRRGGMDVMTASVNEKKTVKGGHGIIVYADAMAADVDADGFDAIVLPGGMPGTTNLKNNSKVCDDVKKMNGDKKLVAAICAAPTVLAHCGVLEGKRASVYPGFESGLGGAVYVERKVVKDGNIITAPGPGAALEFSLALLSYLADDAAAERMREDVVAL